MFPVTAAAEGAAVVGLGVISVILRKLVHSCGLLCGDTRDIRTPFDLSIDHKIFRRLTGRFDECIIFCMRDATAVQLLEPSDVAMKGDALAADPGNIRSSLPGLGSGPFREVSIKGDVSDLDFLERYAEFMNQLVKVEAAERGGEPNKGEAAHSRKSMAAIGLKLGVAELRRQAEWVMEKVGPLPVAGSSDDAQNAYAKKAFELSKKSKKS